MESQLKVIHQENERLKTMLDSLEGNEGKKLAAMAKGVILLHIRVAYVRVCLHACVRLACMLACMHACLHACVLAMLTRQCGWYACMRACGVCAEVSELQATIRVLTEANQAQEQELRSTIGLYVEWGPLRPAGTVLGAVPTLP